MTAARTLRFGMRWGLAALCCALLATAAAPPARAADGFVVESERGTLELGGRVQAGYDLPLPRGLQPSDDADRRFRLKQVRLSVDGELLRELSYEMSLDMRSADGMPVAKDLWLAWAPLGWLQLKMGQLKMPLSRHRLASDSGLLFLDRGHYASRFVPGRDIGAQVALRPGARKLEASFGAFTGQGANSTADDALGLPTLAGRVRWMPLAPLKNREGDFARSHSPALELGAGAAWSHDSAEHPQQGSLGAIDGTKLQWAADVALAWRGGFVAAELSVARFTPEVGPAYFGAGYLLQASYLVAPWRVEPVVAFEDLNPSDQIGTDRERTVSMGLNIYPLADDHFRAHLAYRLHLASGTDDEPWSQDELTLLVQLRL